MSSVMLVAGSSTEPLRKFLLDKGSLKVDHYYDNFASNVDTLRRNVTRAEILVYLFKEDTMNIRNDLHVLQDLLTGSYFFEIEEIIFFCPEGPSKEEALMYISAFWDNLRRDKNARIPRETLRQTAADIPFDEIYSSLLGMSVDAIGNPQMRHVYLVERNSDSTIAYEAEDNFDDIIEPLDYRHIVQYHKAQELARRFPSPNTRMEEIENKLRTKMNVDLGQLEYTEYVQSAHIVIGSGDNNTGVTTTLLGLAVSATQMKQNVLIFDMTRRGGSVDLLEERNVPHIEWETDDMLRLPVFEQKQPVSVYQVENYKLRYHLLCNLISNLGRFEATLLLIDCDLEDLKEVRRMIGHYAYQDFIVTTGKERSILNISDLSPTTLVLSDNVRGSSPLTRKEIIEHLPSVRKILSPLALQDFNIDSSLAEGMLEVK